MSIMNNSEFRQYMLVGGWIKVENILLYGKHLSIPICVTLSHFVKFVTPQDGILAQSQFCYGNRASPAETLHSATLICSTLLASIYTTVNVLKFRTL